MKIICYKCGAEIDDEDIFENLCPKCNSSLNFDKEDREEL